MSAVFVPRDEEVRRRIRRSLEESLFVEAGAGTGKTASLVDRVLTLVTSGTATLDRIAVITFTEAAAVELRDRIRERLEVPGTGLSPEEEDRIARALGDLDRAAIQTLHGFAASILRERPLEAGLPPVFDTLDPIQGDLDFEEAWTEWVDRALDAPELTDSLSLAFSLGLTLAQIRKVATAFHENYDRLETAGFPGSAMPPPSAVSGLKDSAPELERLCRYSKIGAGDLLYDHVQGLLRSIRGFGEADPGSTSAYRRLQRTSIRQSRGRQGDWDLDPLTEVNACKCLKELLKDLDTAAGEELDRVRGSAITGILGALRKFALDSAQRRRSSGVAGFHDLLVWARNLLRDNLEVRDHFRRRYSHLLMDEAQDTDPIQAEIAMFIAEDDPGNRAEDRPRHWREVTPRAGKLFVVGDPKQSIYRFRRADVTQMVALQQQMGGETLHLQQNFRSQRPLLEWVNTVFEPWMGQGFRQARYVSLQPRWEAATDHPAKPGVWSLGGQTDGSLDEIRKAEAEAIAGLLRTMAADQWQVLDQEATAAAGAERYRGATLSDVCILMPWRTGQQILELALEEAGIPFRLEGASLIFATQEIRDLLNCLKAIDDPADQVATVAALRSPAFACSDVDLLRFTQAGGKFDYLDEPRSKAGDSGGPVRQAMEVLRRFHLQRMWVSPTALIDRFIRDRLLMQAAVDHPRTREQWCRYRFMVDQARAFTEAGGDSLRAFLQWMERQASEGARVNESPAPETEDEAVRIMTVHGAKGLEFPIVLLMGLNAAGRISPGEVLFDCENNGMEVSVGSGGRRFATPGYDALAERERQLAADEHVRLLYVAATRARDHLVLSMFRGASGKIQTDAGEIAEILEGRDDLWRETPEGEAVAPPDRGATGPGDHLRRAREPALAGDTLPGLTLQDRQDWIERRARLLQRRSRPVSVAATGLARELREELLAGEPWKRGRGGTSIGRAVHAVLQSIDLSTGAGIDETARAQAAVEGIPRRWSEVAELVRTAVRSPAVRRAMAAPRFWREVPVAIPVGEGVLEGFVDLLFEEEGGLVLVDYKTDAVDSDHLEGAKQRYRLQGGAYALALRKATGMPVKEVIFLFLQADHPETMTDVDEMSADAEARAREYLEGRVEELPGSYFGEAG